MKSITTRIKAEENLIFAIIFFALSLLCFLLIVNLSVFHLFGEKTIPTNIKSYEINKNESYISFSYNRNGKQVFVKKRKKSRIINEFVNKTNHTIYYGPISKYRIKLVNERVDYLSFILLSFGAVLFLYSAKKSWKLNKKVTEVAKGLQDTYDQKLGSGSE